jgi:uncharacterized surface protein with fasciclin (FAS1) repeats
MCAALLCLAALPGCLGLQEDYEYEPDNIDNHLYMTAWEFIESRPDIFSQLKRAIAHSGIDRSVYMQAEKKYTWLLLNNSAFAGAGGLLANNGAADVEDMDRETLRNILLYHTVDGYYHGLGTLSFDAIHVITLWRDPMAIMTLKLSNSPDIEAYSRLVVNDTAGSSATVTAETSNLLASNGAVHIVNKQIIYKP